MANKYNNLADLFTAIANAIRNKTNSTNTIVADNFPTEIRNLKTGFDYVNHETSSITDYEFYNCEDLNGVDCKNLISIGNNAFKNCQNLKSVTLYDGVASIGINAFEGCSSLTSIIYTGTISQWNVITFGENWNIGTPDYIIYCTDGNIAKGGN